MPTRASGPSWWTRCWNGRSMRRISPSSGRTSCGTSARAGRTCNRRRLTSTIGSGRAWRRTFHTINSCGGILAASGSSETAPPVQWYRKLRETSAFVDDTAQVFLGMRLQCAKCHHHPFEKWSQHDYYGFAAFFARVGRKADMQAQRNGRDAEVVYTLRSGAVAHPKTGEQMAPRGLGASVVQVAAGDDPRQKLVDWLADAKNPFFARCARQSLLGALFGRGIVEPPDDMRLTNPPSNPELLDGAGRSFRQERLRSQGSDPGNLQQPGLRAFELAE